MSHETASAPLPDAQRDCPRCGKPVLAVDLMIECPHCGYEIRNPRPVSVGETSVFEVVPGIVVPQPRAGTAVAEEPEPPDPLVGADLGVYHLESLLGRGGMGKVYLARHRDLHRLCALKILMPELVRDDRQYVDHFLNEGRAAASMIHPNVITVHAVGQLDDLYFLEMEFVAGRSLRQIIRDEHTLSPLKATAVAARIADGLAEAHRLGIVHRDLKPDNVLMTLQGIPKIADFGLARSVRSGAQGRPGEPLCGTPQFMAPELFDGAPASPTTDVYSLGVTYFLMLSGRLPFHGETLAVLVGEVLREPLPNIRKITPEVSLEMAECLSLLLDRNPANRPHDGIKAAQLLQAILGQTRDLDSLLDEAFRDDPAVEWINEGRRHLVRVKFPSGRRQSVIVEASSHAAAERLLVITSMCCEADPAFFEQALRLNFDIPHGSIAIHDEGGRPCFMVHDTYPRATVDAEEIRRSVLEVAARADAIEHLLTGHDLH
ncbi:MAG: protein kinase domain-containing protein [Planctomycetaceae bacterium]